MQMLKGKVEKNFRKIKRKILMAEGKIIGYIELFGKLNAIVVKGKEVELQETDLERSDCWQIIPKLLNRE
jgi:hypothetical protein